jgi:hypothetical protein
MRGFSQTIPLKVIALELQALLELLESLVQQVRPELQVLLAELEQQAVLPALQMQEQLVVLVLFVELSSLHKQRVLMYKLKQEVLHKLYVSFLFLVFRVTGYSVILI